jgi:resolvase-like protein
MQLGPDDAAAAVEHHPCPQCDVPAGSACRTRAEKTTAKYHTARFILVPALHDELTVSVPADRGPGKKWTQGPEVAVAKPETSGAPIRLGYARCSTATQELQSQLDALATAKCTRVFSEKISTRIKIRPELEKALTLAHEIKTAAPDQPVILTVHEMKRLARTPPS